jgi:hypothetical protein
MSADLSADPERETDRQRERERERELAHARGLLTINREYDVTYHR